MNETLRNLNAHRSIRAYKDEPVSEEMLDALLTAVQRAPTSINGQGVSVVVVRDGAKRARIAELAGGQPYIAQAPVFLCFVMDYYKTQLACHRKGVEQVSHRTLEAMLAGATDVGIALGTAIAAAESLGLGVVPIGGIRKSPKEMVELLGLPPLTFPLVGLVVGHAADESQLKPRLPMASFRHDERYHLEEMPGLIESYDQTMKTWLTEVGLEREGDWSQKVASVYQHTYFPEVLAVAKAQGLTVES
jgi:FMN reductase [NAD(P)H]